MNHTIKPIQQTGIKGFDMILGRKVVFPPEETQFGYRLLIRGLPGTGKTTLGLHLFHQKLNSRYPELPDGNQSKGLIISFQESAWELDSIASKFGLNPKKDLYNYAMLLIDEFPEFGYTTKWINERSENDYLCILIDGLSILKSVKVEELHKHLASLLSKIRRKNLFLIIIAEEDIAGEDHFFEYMVDGVINLTIDDRPHGHRFLEVSKLRYIDYVRGRHGFEMSQDPDGLSKLQVYPSTACHYILQVANGWKGKKKDAKGSPKEIYTVESGIIGLENIIHGGRIEESKLGKHKPGLQIGDVFIVTAEPETDKIGLGLSFLSPITTPKSLEKGLWVSFNPSTLEKVFSPGFHKPQLSDLAKLYGDLAKLYNDKSGEFAEICCSSGVFHPDKVVFEMMESLSAETDHPTRVIIDGLTNIGRELNDPSKVVEYTIWLARLLAKSNAVSFIFVDLPSAFQPIGNIPMEWDAEATYVGHLRWFEINNQLNLTFVLTKSRYTPFKSIPHYVGNTLVEGKYAMELEDRGWPMINMISGQMDVVHEAKVFLKFFDQNYSTRQIHNSVFEEFKGRYSKDQVFTHVYRIQPTPRHWSFQGYAGAGHSNTKIVCLKQYIMEVLNKDGFLVQIPPQEWEKYPYKTDSSMPNEKYIKAKSYSLWGLARREKLPLEESRRRMLPLYADIGVLCGQIDYNNLLEKARTECAPKHTINFHECLKSSIMDNAPQRWDDMFKKNKTFNELKSDQKKINHSKKGDADIEILYPQWIDHLFALPDLTSGPSGFMAFFLELLIDFSGYNDKECFEQLKRYGLRGLIESESFDKTIIFLRRLVMEDVSKTPLGKIHYHTAFFSRRWFSKIDQYPIDDPRLPDIEKFLKSKWDREIEKALTPQQDLNLEKPVEQKQNKEQIPPQLKIRFQFSVHPLPSTSSESNHTIGSSCLEFYSLGVIRGALAPETAWMFISELASDRTDIKRFESRRGLPVLRENWVKPRENPQRTLDLNVIDQILDRGQFFCNFWIENYWQIESKLQDLLRKIFIEIEGPAKFDIEDKELAKIKPTVKQLRREFLEILEGKE